ncbi:MAG: LPS assembly lipoprotein LptE [Alphaproteobacteria bacterium]
MWSSDRYSARGGALLVALALLAGCGFQPLYGTTASSGGVTEQYQQIHVDPIPDRIGQQIRNFLLDRLNPYGQPARPAYRLTVEPTISITELGIKRDETATRALLLLHVRYSLLESATDRELFAASARSTNSFNIVDSEFATKSAENDALERAAREVSEAIRIRLGIFFKTGE